MSARTIRRPVLRLDGDRAVRRPDALAAEEPLEIRVGSAPLTVTMRTPGVDVDLAAGFLVTEGVIVSADEVSTIRACPDGAVDIALAGDRTLPDTLRRTFLATSACGVCGKESIDGVRLRARWPVDGDPVVVRRSVLTGLPDAMRAAQRTFDRTGGLHAAGLFTADGTLLALREDVGRHNAVDKVVGWALRERRLPLTGTVLLVSGRASFELTQKALMAGVPVLAAVSAPSSLAVDLATETGLTLVGFLRGASMNVYAGDARLVA